MTIRTLIVDDEPLGRLSLATLIADEADFEIVGECADAPRAIAAIAATRPELVFLDVQMPELDGFAVLRPQAGVAPPAVVFVTAHERFALQAFDAQAVDYLLKPFRRERFQAALQRVRRWLAARDEPAAPPVAAAEPERMVVRSGSRLVFVPLAELDYVRAAANYVVLHVGAASHEVRETMGRMEQRLPHGRFLRIHRSYIVNVASLRTLDPAGGGEWVATLRTGRELPVGGRYAAALRAQLAGAGLPAGHGLPS